MSIQHFIEFQSGQARPDRDKVRVTLNTRGVFLLNKFAYEGMQSPGAVTLASTAFSWPVTPWCPDEF